MIPENDILKIEKKKKSDIYVRNNINEWKGWKI